MIRAAVLVLALVACGHHDAKPDAASAPRPADPVAIGDPVEGPRWSEDGQHVAFHVAPHEFDKWKRAEVYLVVDARSHATFTVDHVAQLAFAPDNAHLGVVANGAVVVYDLAKRTAIGVPSPIAGSFEWAGDAIAWMDPGQAIHRRELATGHEVVFRGLPPGDGAGFVVDDAGLVIASNRAAIRVWGPDQIQLVAIDDHIGEVDTFPEGVAYIRVVGERRFFAFVPLAAGAHPVAWPASGPCKRGEMDTYSSFHRCSAERFMIRGARSFCILDVTRGKLASQFGPVHDDFGCVDDLAYAGDLPPGGPYTFFDAKTGRRKRGPDHFYPEEGAADDTVGTRQFCPGGAGDCVLAPSKDRIAGTIAKRATLWTAAGAIEWRAPTPPTVAAVGFAPHMLVVAGNRGELWKVDLATRALTRSKLANCGLDDQEPIAVLHDGSVAAPCHLIPSNGRTLVAEGGGSALAHLEDYGWYSTAATSATDATVGWLSSDGAHAYALPGGHERWVHDVDHYGFAVTADGSRFAATKVIGDHGRPSAYDVSVRDARDTAIATVRFEQAPKSLALSPTGAWLAVISDTEVAIVDVAHAKIVDHLPVHHNPPALHDVVAWAPDGTPRVAYWRPNPAALVIRDVAVQRDLETRLPSRAIDGTVRTIAWSAAGIAVVADERVTLWEGDRASTQLGFAEAAGVEVGADGRAHALGGPNAARSLFATQ